MELAKALEERLPGELLRLLQLAGERAQAESQGLYLVGGAVRDLLLGRPNLDLDLVVEGDAQLLAYSLAKFYGGKVVVHPRFGTAKYQGDSWSLDLAMARSESYPFPGSLPRVKPGTIQADLFRRDFTINAMALSLVPQVFGQLLDPFHGQGDLGLGLVRVLHERSFIDDATRILRGLRYEQRLGFCLEESTEALVRRDAPMLDTISGDRLRHELELIFKEEQPEQALARAQELGVLAGIHPALRADDWLASAFRAARNTQAPDPTLYLCLLAYRLLPDEAQALLQRLSIFGKRGEALSQTLRLKESLTPLEQDLPPSDIYRHLEPYPAQAVLVNALASEKEKARERLLSYLHSLRYVKSSLSGEELKRLGVPPGPRLGEMLRSLREARLDGLVTSREEEIALVRRWLAG